MGPLPSSTHNLLRPRDSARAAVDGLEPLPAPIEPVELTHPRVPEALDGLRILHLSDLHTRRDEPGRDRHTRLLAAIGSVEVDLVVITGDVMDEPGHEPAAFAVLKRLSRAWRSRSGAVLVTGNHDTPELARLIDAHVPGVRRLACARTSWPIAGRAMPLELLALSWPEDPLRALLDSPPAPTEGASAFVLGLAHHPTVLIAARTLGVPVLLAGHTHAGQVRVHAQRALHTSSDLPGTCASGMLRLGGTIASISRGLGDGVVDRLRINCPDQAPLYTLRRGPLPSPGRRSEPAGERVVVVRAW